MGLSDKVLEGVIAKGYVDPIPIQYRAIPLILAGTDVIGSAQTGTGKRAAFALPILTKLAAPQTQPRALMLEPTRELARQEERLTAILRGCVDQTGPLRAGADPLCGTVTARYI